MQEKSAQTQETGTGSPDINNTPNRRFKNLDPSPEPQTQTLSPETLNLTQEP